MYIRPTKKFKKFLCHKQAMLPVGLSLHQIQNIFVYYFNSEIASILLLENEYSGLSTGACSR